MALLVCLNGAKGSNPASWLIQRCAAYSTKKLTPTSDRTSPPAEIRSEGYPVQVTEDGIYKSRGSLMSRYKAMDGKPIFPGKHKFFRIEEGTRVRPGNLLCFQKRLDFHPGLHVGLGRGLALFSYVDGVVYITWEKVNCNWGHYMIQSFYSGEEDTNIYKPHYHVIPDEQGRMFKLTSQV